MEFEKWFIDKFTDMFSRYNPLEKDKDGIYTDRGTLGMWLVWKDKSYEVDLLKKQRQILTNELYIKSDALHFSATMEKLRNVK